MSLAGSIATRSNDSGDLDDVSVGIRFDSFVCDVPLGEFHKCGLARIVKLMNPHLIFLASTTGLALLAGTLRSIKQSLIHRPAAKTRLIVVALLDVLEGLLWTGCLLALLAAAPHPVTLVLLVLIVVSIAAARRLRYREEKRSLNRWLRMGTDTETSLSQLLDSLANGCRSRLARQAKACTNRLNRGQSIADAARRTKLPLDADTLAAIMIPSPSPASQEHPSNQIRLLDSHVRIDREYESSKSNSMVFQQFAYVVATVFLAWLIGMLVRSIIAPVFDDLFSEFRSAGNLSHWELDLVALIGHIFMTFFVAWLLLAMLIRWLPLWMVPCVPWFGGRAIDQWRCEVLRTLERGMRVRQSGSQILQCAVGTTRVRWIRSRCRVAHQFVESGMPLSLSMQRGKLITAREQVWLSCAENNGTLPDAIRKLASDIVRRQTHRWRIRMAWFVPLATVLVGGFVLAHAMFLFHFLFALIRRLSY